MGKSIELKMSRKCFISLLLAISLLIGILPADTSIYAAEIDGNNVITSGLIQHYDGNGYKVELVFTDVWQGACNANLTIKNTSTEVIDNWALSFELGGEILNIWNAYVYEKALIPHGDSSSYRYTIKNAGHNMDIPVGGQVETGMSIKLEGNTNSLLLPDKYVMAQSKMIVSNDDYSVTSFVYGDTNYNYTGFLSIKNISNKVIEDWKLDFVTDIDVINFHTAEIIERQGSHYYINNNGYNSEIKSGEQIFIGFTAKGTIGVNVTGQITEVKMTDVRVDSNSSPDVTITEPITPSPIVTEEPTVTVMATPTPTEFITSEPTATEGITPTEGIKPSVEPTVTDVVTETPFPSVTITEGPTVEPTATPKPTITDIEIPSPTMGEDITKEQAFSDVDGDYLTYINELKYGTDPENPDTDGDGIGDLIEIINGLNPLVPDEEYNSEIDIDSDGLSDCQEIYTYHTNPLISDTDDDGLEDGFEICNGFDPLKVDTDGNGIPDGEEKFTQSFVISLDTFGYTYDNLINSAGSVGLLFGEEKEIPKSIGAIQSVSITSNISKDINRQFEITNIYGKDIIASNIPGLIGVPFDITTNADFDTATLTFTYDDSKLGDCDENNLGLVWYNEAEGHFELIDEIELNTENNTVTYETTHFCTFSIVDRIKWVLTWTTWITKYSNRASTSTDKYAIGLCIDTGSEYFKNNTSIVKNALRRIVSAKTPSDSISIVNYYKRFIEAGESLHFIKDGLAKENEHMISVDLTDNKDSLKTYFNSLKKGSSYCSSLGNLMAIKDYFDHSDGFKEKKAVIMINTSLIYESSSSEMAETLTYIKDNGIELYQLYMDDMPSSFKKQAYETIESTGGYIKEINTSKNFTGILRNTLNYLKDYDVVFLIDSGANKIKEQWDRIITGICENLNETHAERYGVINVFSGIRTDGEDEILSESKWINEQLHWAFTDDSSILNSEINSISVMEKGCDMESFEYGMATNFTNSGFKYTDGIKSVVLITDTILTSDLSIKSYIDDRIPLYVIYIGDAIKNNSIKDKMVALVESTGGFVEFPSDYDSRLTETQKFNDAVSIIIRASLHNCDSYDSDKDGIPDCDELYGMLGHTLEVIKTDPRDKDSDDDGMEDLDEMGIHARMNEEFKDILGDFFDEETDYLRLYDKDFSVYQMNSNPTKRDSDDDGYFDNGLYNDGKDMKDEKPLYKDVTIYSIKDSDTFVPIKNPNTSLPDYYGGNQSWFADENTSWWSDDVIIKDYGCGLIAATDLHIYWGLQGISSDSDFNTFIPNLSKGIIQKDEFINYTRWDKMVYYDDIIRLFDLGLLAPSLCSGLNYYCDDNNIAFDSDWESFAGNSSEKIYSMIKKMLEQSIPVIFGIGPGSNDQIFFYNNIPETDKTKYDTKADNRFQFEVETYYLTDDDGNYILDPKTGNKIEKEYNIDGHYMTITELIEDKDKRWLKVQTWGEYYYIDYDEWVDGQGLGLVNAIINITKEKD